LAACIAHTCQCNRGTVQDLRWRSSAGKSQIFPALEIMCRMLNTTSARGRVSLPDSHIRLPIHATFDMLKKVF